MTGTLDPAGSREHGLRESDIRSIREAAAMLPEVRQLILFGSRAKGTHKPGSDVDLAVKGENVAYETVLRLANLLNEERPLPYFFDLVNYQDIDEPALIAHIDRVGLLIYEQLTSPPAA
jgi:predicted nucleotidyltransferase